MPTSKPRALEEIEYFEAAQAYLKSLPPEHFMEARPQALQRAITLASLDQIRASRPDLHLFNEMAVQYRLPEKRKIQQVVPDNMVVLFDGEITAVGTYDVAHQPAGPFWTLEYVSKSSVRKDYEDNFDRYEQELKVPYYLLFYPDNEELTLYRRGDLQYVSVKPNASGRLLVEEIETEVALLDGWARFWFRGQLLPLSIEFQQQLQERDQTISKQAAALVAKDATISAQAAALEAEAAENARLRALLQQRGG